MLVQTKLFSPPATTPEAEKQQKMMKYMMIFMGVMFYKVPSGLGIYFITSSLWAIGERLLLPKVTHAQPLADGGRGDGGARRRQGSGAARDPVGAATVAVAAREDPTATAPRPSLRAGSPSSGIASSRRPARTRPTARSTEERDGKGDEKDAIATGIATAQAQAEETVTPRLAPSIDLASNRDE